MIFIGYIGRSNFIKFDFFFLKYRVGNLIGFSMGVEVVSDVIFAFGSVKLVDL